MQNVYRGVLLGAVLSLFLCCKLFAKEPDSENVVLINDSGQQIHTNGMFVTYNSLFYSNNLSSNTVSMTSFDLIRSYIYDDKFCKWRYDMTAYEIEQLMKLSYAYIISELLKLNHLSTTGIIELWNLYKQGCWKQKNVDTCQKELIKKLNQRAQEYQQKLIVHEKQIAQEERQKQQNLEKQKALEKSCLEQVYHEDILNISDQNSQYFHDRQNVLQRTKDQNYKAYKQARDLDEQTIGLCIAKNINYQALQSTTGTAMQQQLYNEVADCYKKIAHMFTQPGLIESILAQQSVEFAQCSAEATQIETMELAIAWLIVVAIRYIQLSQESAMVLKALSML